MAVARAATRRGWRVVVEGSAIGPVVLGDGWQIDLVTEGTDRRLEYIGPTTVPGDVLPSDGPLRIDVAADAALPTVVVRVDGELVLEAFLQPAAGPLVPAAGWRSIPGEASLCTDLSARLDRGRAGRVEQRGSPGSARQALQRRRPHHEDIRACGS